jgi:sugar phosphate isomerase/epimerase
MASYEGFYGGSGSVLENEYGNLTGYAGGITNLGFPGSPQTANQLGDTINAIKHGTKVFEVSMLQPDVGESIPTQHFEEMRALMKLTGVKPSVHGPLVDAAGFGEQGWGGEEAREDGERRLFNAIEQAHVLDKSGNLPFVIHAANGAPGMEWRPGDEKKGEGKEVLEKAMMVNQETGQMQLAKREFKLRPEHPEFLDKGGTYLRDEKGKVVFDDKGNPKYKTIEGERGWLYDAEGTVQSINNGEWSNKLTEVAQMSKHVDEIVGGSALHFRELSRPVISPDAKKIFELDEEGRVKNELDAVDSGYASHYRQMQKADVFMENAELSFVGAFGQAYKYGTSEQKKELRELSEKYNESIEEIRKTGAVKLGSGNGDVALDVFAPIKKHQVLESSLKRLQEITSPDRGLTPKVWKMGEEFALDKAAKTFGNLAAKGYDKLGGEKAPVLAIENMMLGQYAFARADEMKKLVEESRKNFVGHLVEKGVDKKKAAKIAKDKIGVTWDVGHLNLMRRKGFGEEDILRETKKITEDKSMVKHVHLTDNFGYADTHLVPGMGNVPVKKILEELEKTGRFDEMRKITEAGGMIQHFKKLPHSMTLAALGSPIYGMKNSPNWGNVLDVQGSYFGGYGTVNPSTHHQYFGAGFTTMPVELGGQAAGPSGGQSRFGGTPMA